MTPIRGVVMPAFASWMEPVTGVILSASSVTSSVWIAERSLPVSSSDESAPVD